MRRGTRYFVIAVIAAVTLFFLATASSAPGQATAAVAVSPAWKATLSGGRIEESSPTVYDIDGDGKLEVIIGTTRKGAAPVLAVLEDSGQPKWAVTLDDPVASAVAVADLDFPPDGRPEIIVTTGGDVTQTRGSIVAYNCLGQRLWKYDTNDAQNTGTASGNFASPAVGDVDGDGDLEIVVGSWDRNIYMLDHRGRYVWHYHNADSIWSTAALADLDRDGDLEVVVGADITGGGILPDGYRTTDGGFLLVLDKSGILLARRQLNEAIYSSPAVGDADRDGDLEIYVGTGMYWYIAGRYAQPYVYGFQVTTDGSWSIQDLPGWPRPTAYPGMSSPALADLDGDDDLEVIVGTGYTGAAEPNACGGQASDPDCRGALYAWHHHGGLVAGFPMWPMDVLNKNAFVQSSPVVGDVDGDGQPEIVLSMLWDVIVVGNNGVQELRNHTTYSLFGSPALSDLDNDGRTDITIGGSAYDTSDRAVVYNFEMGDSSYDSEALQWPTFHGNALNTGIYPRPPELRLATPQVTVLVDASSTQLRADATLEVLNGGQGEIDYWASVSSSLADITPETGSFRDTLLLTLGVDVASLSEGYHTFSVVIEGAVDGEQVVGSPVALPVVLYKGDLYSLYMPMVRR